MIVLSTPGSAVNAGTSAKADLAALRASEERLAHALVSRGLVAREELQSCRSQSDSTIGPEPLLKRLVKAGFLTPSQARRASQEMSALLHQQIPGFELMEKLGQGSMGVVYKGRQLSMNRLVAIKILHPRLSADPQLLQRMVREAHLAAKLSHNNIVQAIDAGSAGGSLHYFVMEYVEGTTIKEELEKGKIYGETEALHIVLQVAHALQHAHGRGLIHRDVKPANIILTNERVAKLADLGMARETADEAGARAEKGMTIGTPFYIAPEQILGKEDIDGRVDIYSLGATLYHMVTGQPPFPGTKIDDVLSAHLKKELTPPDHLNTSLSSGLGEVVEFMMAKKRRKRYRTPADVIIDLECLLNGQPPKLAREQMSSGTLKALAEGAVDGSDEDDRARSATSNLSTILLAVLGSLLALSALLNLLLLAKRG
jgi:serine/threonine-protein kinase